MKLKETRILDAEGARYACIANDYCTRCDCEEYDRILADADTSSRKPGGITVDDLARIAEAIKAVSETDDDVPAIAFALSRASFRTSGRSKPSCPGSPPGHLVLYCGCLKYAFFGAYVLKMRIFVSKSRLSVQK